MSSGIAAGMAAGDGVAGLTLARSSSSRSMAVCWARTFLCSSRARCVDSALDCSALARQRSWGRAGSEPSALHLPRQASGLAAAQSHPLPRHCVTNTSFPEARARDARRTRPPLGSGHRAEAQGPLLGAPGAAAFLAPELPMTALACLSPSAKQAKQGVGMTLCVQGAQGTQHEAAGLAEAGAS